MKRSFSVVDFFFVLFCRGVISCKKLTTAVAAVVAAVAAVFQFCFEYDLSVCSRKRTCLMSSFLTVFLAVYVCVYRKLLSQEHSFHLVF